MTISEVKIFDQLDKAISDPEVIEYAGSVALSLVQKNISEGKWEDNAPLTQAIKGNALPLRDSGQFLASFYRRIEGTKAIVWTEAKQARILHDGGVIRPKTAKYLTIPAGAATRTLMRKYGLTPRACIEGMKAAGWRVWPYFGTGTPVICASFKDKVPICLFILKRSITVPARPYMKLPPEYVKILVNAVERRMFRR
jgi:phage gpG-like protein